MSGYSTIRVDETDGRMTVRLNREASYNSFDPQMIEDLTTFARDNRARTDVHTIILRGADRFFSAGADLSAVDAFRRENGESPDLVALRRLARGGPDMCEAWAALEPVTIAAIEGVCIGAGAALAVSCDYRITGEGAQMRFPEVPLGINLSWNTIPRLVSLIGPARTKEIVMFGSAVTSAQLLAWGAANAVVQDGEAASQAVVWAERIAGLPPVPVRMTKAAVDGAANALHQASSFMDSDQFLLTAMSDDFQEGVAAFLEKRSPKFTGR